MFHERGAVENLPIFQSRNEIVGWTQIGISRPVTGVVVGREMSGIVTKDEGSIKVRVNRFVKPTGNDYILNTLPNSKPHHGIKGKEYIIFEDLSIEYAMKLDYSSYNRRSQSPSNNNTEITSEDLSDTNALIALLPLLLHNGEPAYIA